jgi:hypothetical protein
MHFTEAAGNNITKNNDREEQEDHSFVVWDTVSMAHCLSVHP